MIEFKPYIHHGQPIEEAILGICLLEKLAFGRTYGLIDAETFYFSSHQEVYRTMKEMYDNSVPIDIYTVTERLVNQYEGQDFYGHNIPYFVIRLTNFVVSSAHLEYHCHLIKGMWRRRELLKIRSSHKDEADTRQGIENLNEEINKILGSSSIEKDWYSMDELMFDLMVHQSDMAKGRKDFLTTGFKSIDNKNGGFYPGQMIVIGARPSVGKSALMGQMAIAMAKAGKKVGIISLEMNNNEIAARLAAIETDIDFWTVFRTIANDERLHKIFYDKISKETINLPISLSNKTKVNVSEIKAKATKLKAARGCDCIIVDYLQLVDSTTGNKNYNREQEVAKMSRGLKLMAQELNIPVIVLCQLNRAVTARSYKDRFPRLSDLRESGAIEQDADVVMFLHRDYMSGWQADAEEKTTEFSADLLCPKWRNGSTVHLPLHFDPPKMKFTEILGLRKVSPETTDNFQNDNPF